MTATPWWRSATGYQIYPRSFADSNGDGIGDLPGILSRLDHLSGLGIGFVWLSPVYASPMVDNGYDISDYRTIAPEFGTLADFDRLVAAARARGIGIVMDLVVNHTSDAHDWFRAARADRSAPTRDWYIWRDPAPDGGPPDARQSYFGGPAWTFSPETGQYYLHLFAAAQPDLNWRNPALRAAIWEMMRWWLDRGVAGFRMDVIDLIGKDVATGAMEMGPHLDAMLAEMDREVLRGRDLLTIGESWNATTASARRLTGGPGPLSMIFQFNHVTEGWDPVHGKWQPRPADLPAFKRVLGDWQAALARDGWNSLFLSNHDLPRQVSRYGDGSPAAARALATAMHLMRGTPFVYQGEELGMTNASFVRMDQFRDVETLNHHALMTGQGMPEDAFISGANANGRDNARTPMQWTDGPKAGFTTGTPWIEVNPNHVAINAEAQRADPDSVYHYYRRLIALRRAHPVIVEGAWRAEAVDHPGVMAYARERAGDRLAVIVNLTPVSQCFDVPASLAVSGQGLIATHAPRDSVAGTIDLAPWEGFALLARGPD